MFPLEFAQRKKMHFFRVTTRKEIQVPRKIWHMTMGATLGFLYLNVVQSQTLALWLLRQLRWQSVHSMRTHCRLEQTCFHIAEASQRQQYLLLKRRKHERPDDAPLWSAAAGTLTRHDGGRGPHLIPT